jgi:hypothetical protein
MPPPAPALAPDQIRPPTSPVRAPVTGQPSRIEPTLPMPPQLSAPGAPQHAGLNGADVLDLGPPFETPERAAARQLPVLPQPTPEPQAAPPAAQPPPLLRPAEPPALPQWARESAPPHAAALPSRPAQEPGPPSRQAPPSAAAATPPQPSTLDPPRLPVPHAQSRLPPPTIDIGRLASAVPRAMRAEQLQRVELRIFRRDVEALARALAERGAPIRRDGVVTSAVSARLRSPFAGLSIVPSGPETQWVESTPGFAPHGEYASWGWSLMPNLRGRALLQLSVAVRTLAADGSAIETALPEQAVEIRIRRNWGRTLRRALGLTLLTLLAIAAEEVGEHLLDVDLFALARGLTRL